MDVRLEHVDGPFPEVHNHVCEFHCMMARRALLDEMGGLDERLITREQIDFALRTFALGARTTFAEKAWVTYLARDDFDPNADEIDLEAVLAGEPARAAIVLDRLDHVRRVLRHAGGERVRARSRLRRAQRRRHRSRVPLRGAARHGRGRADGGDPLRRDHVDQGVGAHADDPARQPARRPDGERRPRGRATRRSRTSATTPKTSPS